MPTRIARLLVAALLGLGAVAVIGVSPASAAACPKGSGVTVVVGSGVRCDANGGGPATSNFAAAGHSLDSYRGFVCRVDGAPSSSKACAGYPPADAYWGLFWSNGTSGRWVYAGEGAGTLDVPKGGWVAFVFQTSDNKTYPSMTPVGASPPRPQPTKAKPATRTPTSGSGSARPGPTPTPDAAKQTAAKDKKKGKANSKNEIRSTPTPSGSTSAAPGAEVTESDDPIDNASQQSDGSGSLGWVAAALAVALLAGMAVVLVRRRTGRAS